MSLNRYDRILVAITSGSYTAAQITRAIANGCYDCNYHESLIASDLTHMQKQGLIYIGQLSDQEKNLSTYQLTVIGSRQYHAVKNHHTRLRIKTPGIFAPQFQQPEAA